MRWSVASPLRIVLLDDHALIRDALKIRLSLEADFKVLGAYSTSRYLIDSLRGQDVDLLVLDYLLGDGELDGLRLIKLVHSHYPTIRILIYSSLERPATVNMSIRAGAHGFVGKSQETEDLLHAIRMVAMDRIYMSPAISTKIEKLSVVQLDMTQPFDGDKVLADHPQLSPKESEVLRCCLEGMSVSQIASKFLRSRKTISGQKQPAFRKLGISTDTELFKLQNQLNAI